MDQAKASLPAEPERQRELALSMGDSGSGDDSVHIAVIEHVGEAMRGWDTETRGDSWAPASSEEPRRDLPPLRLREARSRRASS